MEVLSRKLVISYIAQKTPITDIIKWEVSKFFEDYVLADYVHTRLIPEHVSNGETTKVRAVEFFNDYRHIDTINISQLINSFSSDVVEKYNNLKKFPYPFHIHIFDTFIVLEINPNSLATEFLIITPAAENGSDDIIGGIVSSIAITSLLSGLETSRLAELGFYLETNELLLRLEKTRKKRWFGLF